jgi:hypothetical protein
MFMTFSSYVKMEGEIVNQQKQLAALNKKILEVEQESRFQEELLAEKRIKNAELNKLKEMGFGLAELTTMRNLANEIATESGKSTERGEAVREFISDIGNHLHDYLHLRNKVSDLKANESTILAFLGSTSRLGNTVSSFLSRKPTENAVKDLIEIIEAFSITESTAVDSVSAKERKKTVQSAINSDPIEFNQGKQEQIKSESQVQKDEVYIPSPFSDFAQPSFIPSFDEHDPHEAVVRDPPKKKHEEVEPNGKSKIKW